MRAIGTAESALNKTNLTRKVAGDRCPKWPLSGPVARSRSRATRPVTSHLDDPSEPQRSSLHSPARHRSVLVREVVAQRSPRDPRLGRAWVDPDGNGGWRRRRGRSPDGARTEAEAAERMLALVREHDGEQTLLERDAEERPRRLVGGRIPCVAENSRARGSWR
jgi:hypothetical protein